MKFEVLSKDPGCNARSGRIETARGAVDTPVFMPVGTAGSVKSISPDELESLGAKIILANTYHLYLRPGTKGWPAWAGFTNLWAGTARF